MVCYHPLRAWRSLEGPSKSGKWSLVFSKALGYGDLELEVPCGRCIGCRLERSRQWAMRCVLESQLYERNAFVTLTYRDADLPSDSSVSVRALQLFLKRLRKRYSGERIRFFACGEYGSRKFRPHYHVLLFNHSFDDATLWCRRCGQLLYRSSALEELWPYGFSTIGSVTFESAAYCARYILKKVTGKDSREHYGERRPEFVTMSRKPGIAAEWFDRYREDVYPGDRVVLRGGLSLFPPKYFDKLYERNGGDLSQIKRMRERWYRTHVDVKESYLSRVFTREEIQEMRADMLVRGLEEDFDFDETD